MKIGIQKGKGITQILVICLLLQLIFFTHAFNMQAMKHFQVKKTQKINSSQENGSFITSIFYCGFGGDFCGQSSSDDVNLRASFVILAFANTKSDGSIVMDSVNYPFEQVRSWKASGKKVILSVGGQNGNWADVFASQANSQRFIDSFNSYLQDQKYSLDGVDLDIEMYLASPRTVANMITKLKRAIGNKLLIVSPECVGVYQGSPVPNPDVGGQAWNYFVPIIKLADQYIDFYQVQAYNNWYDGLAGGSLDYLKDIYLNWRNLQGMASWAKPIPDFAGVNGQKLLMGLLASSEAGQASYFAQPSTVVSFVNFINQNNYPLKGFMLWDSHWDQKNGSKVSDACMSPGMQSQKQGESLQVSNNTTMIYFSGLIGSQDQSKRQIVDIGQANQEDNVNSKAEFVLLGLASISRQNGSIVINENTIPNQLVSRWKNSNKKVLLSIGGIFGSWADIFKSQNGEKNFINSLNHLMDKYHFDGVDIVVVNYLASPRNLSKLIESVRKNIGNNKVLIVSTEPVTIFQGIKNIIPSPDDQSGHAWNYFIPLVKLADSFIDFYNVHAYNNWYDGFAGNSTDYMIDIYRNWRNLQGLNNVFRPFDAHVFDGVKTEKILMSLLGSKDAGVQDYYKTKQTIQNFKKYMNEKNYTIKGYTVWESYWDKRNNYEVSNACLGIK